MTVIHFPRNLMNEPELASAAYLALSAESDEEFESALYGVSEALRCCAATQLERAPVWRLLIREC